MTRLLFHAINGTGLGHVVRLSWIALALERSGAPTICDVVTTSRLADTYFGRSCTCVPCDLLDLAGHCDGVLKAIERFRPDVMVFDTRWPPGIPERLGAMGIKRVLIARALSSARAETVFREARTLFELIVSPHTQHELTQYYGPHPAILSILNAKPFIAAGPVARVRDTKGTSSPVVFSLGGGGEYLGRVAETDRIATRVEAYVEAARQLKNRGYEDLRFIAGPLYKHRRLDGPLAELNEHECHKVLGPQACVISRGGYNTCWEAIGAGSHLVLGSSYTTSEDVNARCRYLDDCGFARATDGSPEAIVDAVVQGHARCIHAGTALVNSGLPHIVGAILD